MLGSYATNDLVNYGGNVYLATTTPSGTPGTMDGYSWSVFVPKATGFTFRGAWQDGQNSYYYQLNDVVTYEGSAWIVASTSTGMVNGYPGQNSGIWTVFAAAGATGLDWRGAWSGSADPAYAVCDAVEYNGSSYTLVESYGNMLPPAAEDGSTNSGWNLVAAKGSEGPTGPAAFSYVGAYGTGGNYSIGDVVTESGSTYLALDIGSLSWPAESPDEWALLAAAGATGPTGADGITPAAPFTITQSENNADYPLTISSANEQSGGAGYSDILKLINSKAGATNAAKHFRMNTAGALEIVNSAYSSTIFSIADSGIVTSSNLGDTGWISVTSFNSGFSGTSVAYRRLNNVVYLRGRLSGGTAGSGAFTLPEGYRPATIEVVIPTQQYGTAGLTYTSVGNDGNVVPNATATWLSSVSFPVG
jgi:hypothetical protein